MNERFVIIDIETTGHSVEQGDRIIQIGAVIINGGEIVEKLSTYINPEIPIPAFIENLTGITDEMVKDEPTFSEIIPHLMTTLENSYFVAHNVQFDFSFLQNQLQQLGYEGLHLPKIDTVELSRMLLPHLESYKLTQLAEHLQLSHDRPHQADSDALVTAELFLYLMNKLKTLPLHTLKQLFQLSKYLQSDLERLLTPLIEEKEKDVNSRNFRYIQLYRDLAVKRVEEDFSIDDYEQIDLSFDDCLSLLTKQINSDEYEVREGQIEMIEHIYTSFRNRNHLLIEAGTGTGKSLAYLLPAVLHAKEHGKTVVVSTHTIVLQQQLLEKTIPLLQSILPISFSVAVLKGRNHYLCLRKFENRMQNHDGDHYDTILAKGQILVWLTETESGDVEELNLPAQKNGFWYEVQSDSDTCLNHRCPWFSYCFYHRARNDARNAHIVITNHALLFTDHFEEQSIIPSYSHVIIDEAHHLEEVASAHLGTELEYKRLSTLINRVSPKIVENIMKNSSHHSIDEDMNVLKETIDELFSMLRTYVLSKNGNKTTEIGRFSYKYESHLEDGIWNDILESCLKATSLISLIRNQLGETIAELDYVNEANAYMETNDLLNLKSYLKLLQQLQLDLEKLLLQYDPSYVYWIEVEEKGAKNATFLYNRPIEVSEQFANEYFMKKDSVVLTSATLSIKNNFSYMIERLGLEDFGPKTVIIPSPFHYEKQAKLIVPTDVANIKDGEATYIKDISHKITKIARVTNGRMLVLFTSFDMLKKTYELVKEQLHEEHFTFIAQGIYSTSRNKLIKSFKMSDKAILFGTSTFWEGVDIPGEDLSCLVIARLPFAPPNDPVLFARSEKLKAEGKNPFMELALPQAILRFKQGFGRLIRTKKDLGVAIILDNRIIRTRYGAAFIQALPKVPLYTGTTDEMIAELEATFLQHFEDK